MALKPYHVRTNFCFLCLAVPSYGAMALKRLLYAACCSGKNLAVPSYGAMALKHEKK